MPSSAITKNDRRTINGWCMYDWANSVYSLTITTAVFPSYFIEVTGGKNADLTIFGLTDTNSVIYSYTLAISFLLVAFLNPVLSAIADFGGYKKKFMKFFCYLGGASCLGLYFFDSGTIPLGVILFGLASVGFAGSLVFYNSYLPEIATEDRFDHISAKGFALGYTGSVILLIANLIMILFPDSFGFAEGSMAPRVSFLMVGLWWIGFAQFTFRRLPGNIYNRPIPTHILKNGFLELKKVWNELKQLSITRKFLLSFFLYSMGVQTVMYMATIFGEEVVDMVMQELIILVLILQLVAIPGAWFFAKLSGLKGNIFSLLTVLFIWILICIAAYFIGEGDKIFFYILGFFVGLVMGGIQSMSRSTYSKLIPANTIDHASWFSFYETLEKVSIALGTFTFGFVRFVTGDMNLSAIALGIFFIAGFIILLQIPSRKSYQEQLKNS